MTRINLWLATLVAALFLTGCGSTSLKFYNYSSKLPPPAAGMARIWFYRPVVVVGDAMTPTVMVDGVAVGKSLPGKFFHFDTTPGRHKISTDPELKKKIAVNISSNVDTFVECNIAPGTPIDHIVPTWMNESDGRRAIDNLRFGK